jgi:two-component sensor histidine kinase
MAMALAIHELCTNALKHGALTRPAGYVELRWSIDPNRADCVHIVWQEHGGPTPEQPSHAGFGTRLLQSAVSRQIGSPVRLGFEATGLICEMRLTRGTSNGKTSSTARRVKRKNKGR